MSTATGIACTELSNDEYHSHAAIGASMLETFRESRRLYEARYVTKTLPAPPPSPAMELGTAIHLRLLEPERYRASLAEPYPELAPDGKKWLRRQGSDHERWWADEVAKREGKLALEQATIDQIEAIAASVLAKPWAKSLLASDGRPEYSIFWTDEETGLPLKCRVDWFRPIISIDLKTTGNATPERFVKQCVSLGYHRKRSHYLAGIRALTGDKRARMVHVAVATDPPYPAGGYDLVDRDRMTGKSLGDLEWRYTLRQLQHCLDTGDFSDPWELEILTLEYPAWAYTQQSYH